MVKNWDLSLQNAARGLRPRAAFSRPLSQFFTIQTSKQANNIYVYYKTKTNLITRVSQGANQNY